MTDEKGPNYNSLVWEDLMITNAENKTQQDVAAPNGIPVTSDSFREAFRHHAAGVAILTADAGNGPVALTVTSLISVSMDPPTVAFSLSAHSSSAAQILEAGSLAIHFLRSNNLELANRCATKGAKRFADSAEWTRLVTGEPLYTSVETWFRAEITGKLEVNGSTLVSARLTDGWSPDAPHADSGMPMVYCDRHWHAMCVESVIAG